MNQEVPRSPSSPSLASGRTSRFGWLSWIVDPVAQWSQDHCLIFSASIAFFAAFSLAPTLVIMISVASIFFGADAVQGRLFDEISGVVGADAAHALEAIVARGTPISRAAPRSSRWRACWSAHRRRSPRCTVRST